MQYLYGAFQGEGKNFFIVLCNYMQVFKTEYYCLMPSFRGRYLDGVVWEHYKSKEKTLFF